MDPFAFWDKIPVVGSYFAGMPRSVKFLLTAALVIVIVIGLGKNNESRKPHTSHSEKQVDTEKPKRGEHHHRHHQHEESSITNQVGSETPSNDLFGEEDNGLFSNSMDLGAELNGDNSGTSIESILSGEPITTETEITKKVEKTQEKKEEKQVEDNKKEALPSEEGPIGLPEDLEEELEAEEKETDTKKSERRKIKQHFEKKPPVEFEEIKLTPTGARTTKPRKEQKTTKSQKNIEKGPEKKSRGGGFFSKLLGGSRKKKKQPTKLEIMKMMDKGQSDDEITKILADSGMNHGEARRYLANIRHIWDTERKPLLDQKSELEEKKKTLQYQYLRMEIDEETFKKMMTDLQKKIVDVDTKIKMTEKYFK